MEKARKVHIAERATKKVVASVPIWLKGMNYKVNSQEYFDMAWESAIADKLVDPEKHSNYRFFFED